MNVLLIEDDQRLARLMARVLSDERWRVVVAHDGDAGLDMALGGAFDVAVIDWMLPGRDGPAIVRGMRAARVLTAVLMLTARGQLEDKAVGFASGVDDYLVKPFAFEELLMRVRALARRGSHDGAVDELRAGELVLDLRGHTARRGTRMLELTPTEWNLLEYLLRHRGQTLSRSRILDSVWPGDRDVQPQMVDVYISYLRRKLNEPRERDPITTVRGIGYRFEAG
ncbi:MAG: response regulator transcription factor [Chloroflexi bacterium]|nr:response regulator transcription factor [Chloroflexota bacterium]